MISVAEAYEHIYQHKYAYQTVKIPLSRALGRITSSDWFSERPLPPFNRVMMDGIAIRYADFDHGNKRFKIQGTVPAGTAQVRLEPGICCVEIMTGAMLPEHADTVIRYEDIHIENGEAYIQVDTLRYGQNVHQEGLDRPAKSCLLKAGTIIGPAVIGVAATLGLVEVEVRTLPRILVVSTGDELVEIDQIPELHQIRRSNVYAIQASLQKVGYTVDQMHMPDDKASLKLKLDRALQDYDLIVLSGGVSKGKYDYLPEIFESLEVEKHFHRVAQRPGKPFWFGSTNDCTIFALPGNPVSSFMCTQVYVLPWLHYCMHDSFRSPQYATLTKSISFKPNLQYFAQVKLFQKKGVWYAEPCQGNGSGDLANLVESNAFVGLPKGQDIYLEGTICEVFPF